MEPVVTYDGRTYYSPEVIKAALDEERKRGRRQGFVAGIVMSVVGAVGVNAVASGNQQELSTSTAPAATSTAEASPSSQFLAPAPSSTSVTPTPESTSSTSTTSSESPTGDKKYAVLIDPGHSAKSIQNTDELTGLPDIDYLTSPEFSEVTEVSQQVGQILSTNGYTVCYTRPVEGASATDPNNPLATVSLRDRSEKAKSCGDKGADMAVSIHTDHTQDAAFQLVTPQEVGQFRVSSTRGKVEFTNTDVATKSKTYAETIAAARGKAQNTDVSVGQINFDGRPPLAAGNIPLVMLFSDQTPWVYNEMGVTGPKTQQANPQLLADYAVGIADGIMAALPK